MDERWCVLLDGTYLKRDLTKAEAYGYAKFMQEGFDRHKASDKRRTGELSCHLDHDINARNDRRYREMCAHTTVGLS